MVNKSFHSDSWTSEDELPANSSSMSHLFAHTESFGQSYSSLEKGLEDDLNLSDSSEEGEDEVANRQQPDSSESFSDSSDSSDSDLDTEVGESNVEDEGRSKEEEVEICGNFQEPQVAGW